MADTHPKTSNVRTNKSDNILVITLDRPEKKNALTVEMLREVVFALESVVGVGAAVGRAGRGSGGPVVGDVGGAGNVGCVVITGSGGCFCSGGDLDVIRSGPEELEELVAAVQDCCLLIRSMPIPVMAAVEGHAMGAGMALTLACDMVVASCKASFSSGFIGLGLTPGCGTLLLASVVGYHRACEFLLTGRIFDADESLAIGLVNKVVNEGEALVFAMAQARNMAEFSRTAVFGTKALISKSYLEDLKSGKMQEQFGMERRLVVEAWKSQEFQRHLAYLQK